MPAPDGIHHRLQLPRSQHSSPGNAGAYRHDQHVLSLPSGLATENRNSRSALGSHRYGKYRSSRVGVDRGHELHELHEMGLPHTRGGGPRPRIARIARNGFAPYAWGWTEEPGRIPGLRLVFATQSDSRPSERAGPGGQLQALFDWECFLAILQGANSGLHAALLATGTYAQNRMLMPGCDGLQRDGQCDRICLISGKPASNVGEYPLQAVRKVEGGPAG
jgi:hypothetical protein